MSRMRTNKPRLSEAQMRAHAEAGGTWGSLSKQTGWPICTLSAAASVLGIQSGGCIRHKPADLHAWVRRLAAGDAAAVIAADAGLTVGSFRVALYRSGLPAGTRKAVLWVRAQDAIATSTTAAEGSGK